MFFRKVYESLHCSDKKFISSIHVELKTAQIIQQKKIIIIHLSAANVIFTQFFHRFSRCMKYFQGGLDRNKVNKKDVG